MSDFINWLNNQAAQKKIQSAPRPGIMRTPTYNPGSRQVVSPAINKQIPSEQKSTDSGIDWDGHFLRPLQDFLNKVTAGSIGTNNALNTFNDEFTSMSPEQYEVVTRNAVKSRYPTPGIGGGQMYISAQQEINPTAQQKADKARAAADAEIMKGQFSSPAKNWIDGWSAGWNGDTKSENYLWGSDVIENASDYQGRYDPNYVNVKDNANPTGKFWGGLALDIVGDPLTWLPGGVIAAPVRGMASAGKAAIRAAKAGEAGAKLNVVPKIIKGAYLGNPGEAYKVGRFTQSIKPSGLKAWSEARNFKAFDDMAKTAGLSTDDLINLSKGTVNPTDLAAKLAHDAGVISAPIKGESARKAEKALSKFDHSPEALARLAAEAAPYADDAEKIYKNIWKNPKTGASYQARAYQGIGAGGVSLYRGKNPDDVAAYLARPENRIASDETKSWVSAATDEATTATAHQPQRIVVEALDDGSLVARDAVDDGVLPSSGTIHNTVSLSDKQILGISPEMTLEEAFQQGLTALERVHPRAGGTEEAYRSAIAAHNRLFASGGTGIIPAPQLARDAAIAAESAVTKVNPTVYPDVAEAALTEALRAPGAVQTLEALEKINADVISSDFATAVTRRAEIMDDVLTTALGADGFQMLQYTLRLDPSESVSRFLFGNDKMAIGILEGDDQIVFRAIEEMAKFPVEIPGYTDKARAFMTEWEALGTPAAKSAYERAAYDDYIKGMAEIGVHTGEDVLSPGARLLEEPLNPNVDAVLEVGEDVATRAVDDVQIDGVNIFGARVTDAEAELARVIDDSIESAKARNIGEAPKATRGLTSTEYAARLTEPDSANMLGHSGADSLAYREVVDGPAGAAQHLKAPNVSNELDDIYDHVVGFARKPLDFGSWINAVRRIGASESAKMSIAKDLLKRMSIADNSIPDMDAALRIYSLEYIPAFDKATQAVVETIDSQKVGQALTRDMTTGVDFAGRVFRDKPGGKIQSKGLTPDQAKLADAVDLAREVEAHSVGITKLVARGNRRTAVGAKADNRISELSTQQRLRAGENVKMTDPATGNPVFARTTDGAWLDAKELNTHFLRGSVSAFAENFIEHSKLVGDGLRNGIRSIAPLATWRRNTYRVFETRNIVETDEQLTLLMGKLKESGAMFGEAFMESARETLKKAGKAVTPANVKAALPAIQKQIFKGLKFNELVDHGYQLGYRAGEDVGDLGLKIAVTPWRNTVEISAILDDALRAAGLGEDMLDASRAKLWDSIAMSVEIGATGGFRISPARLEKLLRTVQVETGTSRPARRVEIHEGSLEGILRNVGGDLRPYNKDIGVRDVEKFETTTERLARNAADQAQASGQKNLTAKGHGQAEFDRHGFMELMDGVEIVVNSQGKQTVISKSKMREYDIDTVRKLAEAIAHTNGEQDIIEKFSSGESLANYLRARLPQVDDLITAEKARRISEVEAVNNTSMWNGDEILARSKSVNIPAVLKRNSDDLGKVFQRIQNTNQRAMIENAAALGYKRAIEHVSKAKSRTYRQESSIVAWRAISSSVDNSGLFKVGSIEAWNSKMLAARKLRLMQQESGVFDVTALSRWGGRTRPNGGIDPDFAYIGALDVIDAISNGMGRNAAMGIAMPDDAARVLFDTLKIDGKTFPITVAQELSVLSMKMNATGMDDMARAAWLYDSAIFLLKKTRGYDGYAKAAMKRDSDAARAVAMLATALSSRNVADNLMQRHLNRGAAAVATAEKNSLAIARPIMDKLTAVADNMFATSGERSTAIDKSIDELRKELQASGFAKGSLEHMISSKKLETHSLTTFSPMQHNTARLQTRMTFAGKETPARWAADATAERVTTSKMLEAGTTEATMKGMVQRADEAIASENPEMMQEIIEDGLHLPDYVIENHFDMHDHLVVGSDLFNPTMTEREAGKAASDIRDTMDALTDQLADLESTGRGATEEAKALTAEILRLRPMHKDADALYMAIKEGKDPVDIEAIAARLMEDTVGPQVGAIEPVSLATQQTKSAVHRLYALFSGQAGKRDVLAPAGVAKMELEKSGNHIEKALEKAEQFAKKNKIDEATQKNILLPLLKAKTPDARRAIAQKLPPEQIEFAQMVFQSAGSIIDGSALFRAGLDADWLNTFIGKTNMGGLATLPKGIHGVELVQHYRNKMADVIMGTDNGVLDWLSTIKGYNQAIHAAQHAPNIAADFSAKYGHKAYDGLSEADAIGMGWVKIKKTSFSDGPLSHFVDHDQLYPRDMVEQFANLEKFYVDLEKNNQLNKFVRVTDRITHVLKASLTLWTPRNHLVNATGEYMTNISAGVWSAKWYKQSSQVMKAGGMLDNVVSHNYKQETDLVGEGVKTLEDMANVPHGKVRIGGKQRELTAKERFDLYNRSGVIVSDNTVEDIIRVNGEAVQRADNLWLKMTSPIWKTNRGLAQFASRRDNLFRIAHAEKILESKTFRSIEEASDYLRREITDWHPTMHHLSSFEQKYARRLIFFYTWQRGALKKMMEMSSERPGTIGGFVKFNVEASAAMGTESVSGGHPMPNDPRLPSWANQHVTGPVMTTETGDVISTSLNVPWLDVMQTYFGGIQYDKRRNFWDNTFTNAQEFMQSQSIDKTTPLVKAAVEGFTGGANQFAGKKFDWGQWATDQTGLGAVSRATGFTPFNDRGIGPLNEEGTLMPYRTGITNERDWILMQQKAILGLFTPFKPNMVSEYGDSAERERIAANKIIQRRMMNDPTLPFYQK